MLEIGTFDHASRGIVVNFGKIVKVGDKIWYRGNDTKEPTECVVDGIFHWLERDAVTGEITVDMYVINSVWVGWDSVYSGHKTLKSISPSNTFADRPDALKIAINNGKFVGVGDVVWLWRKGAQPALVKKRVCGVNRIGLEASFGKGKHWVQCTYDDNMWARKEDPQTLYSSEAEAMDAHPQLAKQLETALIRAGRNQGERVAA